MATVDEILATMSDENITATAVAGELIIIDPNTRQFSIPGVELTFGVEADAGAERKYFLCPRYVGDGLDLTGCFVRVNFRNANGEMDSYLVDDVTVSGDNVIFSWLLSQKVTRYKGQVKFVVCAVGPDLKVEWHTTLGTGIALEGLEPDTGIVTTGTADVVAQLVAMVESQTAAVKAEGGAQIKAVQAAAEAAEEAAVAEIEAKRTNSLDSIPDDYTALSATVDTLVRETAPGIVCSAEGEVITLNDASNQGFRGMRIFGKSTQDGTPTPESPVEIVSIENPVVSVDEQTLSIPRTLPGIPVTSGGNYTDANGQQWICDEVDFARGVYVQRVYKETFDGSKSALECSVLGETMRFYMRLGYMAGASNCICDKLPFVLHYTNDAEHAYITINNIYVYMFINSNRLSSVDADGVKLYLSRNPIEVMYVIATPIETPLSESELAAYRALHTNKPNTTILNDSGAYMSVDYTADTKLYIDNKIKEALK